MRFTPGMITALLARFETKDYITGDKRRKSYRWVSLLPKSEREMDPDILYVCRTSEALQRNHLSDDIHFVTANDCYFGIDEWNNKERLRNIIVLTDPSKDVPWILNLILNRFLELNDWNNNLQHILMNGGGYQELIDASEDIFKNSIFILDDAFRLLAYGKRYLSDDPLHVDLYKRGYYPASLLDIWYSSGRIDDYRRHPDQTLWTDKIGRYPSISKWCRQDGILLVHGVLVFAYEEIAADTIDLFNIFMEAINYHFHRDINSNQGVLLPHNSLFIDIFSGKVADPQQIEGIASEINLSVNGFFVIYRIAFHDIGQVLIGSFIQRLSAILPESKIVTNGYDVFVINSLNEMPLKAETRVRLEAVLPLLEEHDGICGISFPYSRLTDLKTAGTQAFYALQFGPKAKKLLPSQNQSDRFFFYSDVVNFCMIENSRKGDFDPMVNNVYRSKLSSLREFDEKNESSLFDILFIYLVCERRATDAAEQLHMHRSTVIYHIQRITELLDMDLNEFLVRQGLITAYLYLMLEGTEVMKVSPEE